MKIALIGPTYPFRGGLAHYTTLLVRQLRRRHQVNFYSYRKQYPAWLFPGSVEPDPSAQSFQEPCERLIEPFNPLTWWRTGRWILADRPDALLLQWWTPFWLPLHVTVSLMARRAGIPIIYLCHQLVEPDSSPLEWLTARPALALAQSLILVTESEYRQAQQAFPQLSIRKGHHPLYDSFPSRGLSREQARHELDIPQDVPLILFFGFVRRYKGLPILLDALAQTNTQIHLLVAGEFWEDPELYAAQIARLGLADQVIIHNRYIPNEAVEAYFVAADALVLPYLSGSQSGVSMLALHHQLPVITTSVGGLAETIQHEHTGLIVPPGESAALAAALQRFFAQELAPSMRANIASLHERLSWDALIQIIEELLRESTGHDPVTTDDTRHPYRPRPDLQ
jgi:glycosyltransferase involved in cell wall biosynthesis